MIYAAILALHRDVREIIALLHGGAAGPLDASREVFHEAGDGSMVQPLSSLERSAIINALKASDGNRRRASQLLGISEFFT